MNRRLLVMALVLAAVAVLAVSSASAAPREGYAVVGVADAEQLFPASVAPQPYDDLMDPEFGCGDRGQIELPPEGMLNPVSTVKDTDAQALPHVVKGIKNHFFPFQVRLQTLLQKILIAYAFLVERP